MAVTELAARQAAISMMEGKSNSLINAHIDAYERLLAHRTKYEQVHQKHSENLLPVGHEADVITRLMGKEQYNMAHSLLSRVVQLMQASGDGAAIQLSKYS